MIGDADCDCTIKSADAAMILRALVRLDMLTSQSERNADADNDGEITAADASAILRFSSDWSLHCRSVNDGSFMSGIQQMQTKRQDRYKV